MSIVPIKGRTKFTINLDPTVWIFDKRKIDLETYIQTGEIKPVGEREVSGSYAVPFEPFLKNAEPLPEAKEVICHLKDNKTATLSLKEALQSYLAFCLNGKAIKEDGPIHLYYPPEKHNEPPIKAIVYFEVK